MLGGGLSYLSRAFGLGSDQLVSLRLVLSNGTLVQVSSAENRDLWFASRGGGGGSFGIVTSMTFRLHAAKWTRVGGAQWSAMNASSAADVLTRYLDWLDQVALPSTGAPLLLKREAAPAALQLFITLFRVGNDSAQVAATLQSEMNSLLRAVRLEPTAVNLTMGSFFDFESQDDATSLKGKNGYMTSGVISQQQQQQQQQQQPRDRMLFAETLTAGLLAAPSPYTLVNFHDMGGAIAKQNAADGDDAFSAHRHATAIYQVKTIWSSGRSSQLNRLNIEWARDLNERLTPFLTGAYVNYIDPLLAQWEDKYWGSEVYEKLVRVKRARDPTNFFSFKQSIGAPSNPCAGALAQMKLFQVGQTAMNSSLLGSLFAEDARVYVPASLSPPVQGPRAIALFFQSYFDQLSDLQEEVDFPGYIVSSNGFAGFAKTNRATFKGTGRVDKKPVINWMQFDCSQPNPLITEYRAVFPSPPPPLLLPQRNENHCPAAVQKNMDLFQKAMVTLDGTAAGQLFAYTGSVRLPGYPTITGPSAISNFFQSYFDTLSHQTETVEIELVNGNWGALAKNETGYFKKKNKPSTNFQTYNLFNVDCETQKIINYIAIF